MASLDFRIPKAEDIYVFIPAFCYGGNKRDVLKKQYPPHYTAEEAAKDLRCQADVPCLGKDGSGKIEASCGDMATPCIGLFFPSLKQAHFVFTAQKAGGYDIGISYTSGKIQLTCPAVRDNIYRFPSPCMEKNEELYPDYNGEIPHRYMVLDCADIAEFYRIFFENRKIMNLPLTEPFQYSRAKQIEIQIAKMNQMNWKSKGEFYAVGTTDHPSQVWQSGWVGGPMTAYAMAKLGGELEEERGTKTMLHLIKCQGQSGFFYGGCDKDGVKTSDGKGGEGTENWAMVRKSADCLYFIMRYLMEVDGSQDALIQGAKKCADAFVKLWQSSGEWGLFADTETGETTVGGSSAGALAGAGLVKAAAFFKEPAYLQIAQEAADYYHADCLKNGCTCGGPGDILHAYDSESAFALLESLTVLHEETHEKHWLAKAEFAAHVCSSWTVSYDFEFPWESELSRIGAKTTGTIFANIQNKHSAPGICTLSPVSLRKLYEWTKNPLYQSLYKEIALVLSQFMSTEKRPIYSWDNPKQKLCEGFINERVNMSDWEGKVNVGGLFNGSCWSETANLLTLVDCPEIK